MMTLLRIIDRLRQSASYAIRGISPYAGILHRRDSARLRLASDSTPRCSRCSIVFYCSHRRASLIHRSVRRLYIDPGYAVTDRGSHDLPAFQLRELSRGARSLPIG